MSEFFFYSKDSSKVPCSLISIFLETAMHNRAFAPLDTKQYWNSQIVKSLRKGIITFYIYMFFVTSIRCVHNTLILLYTVSLITLHYNYFNVSLPLVIYPMNSSKVEAIHYLVLYLHIKKSQLLFSA